MDTFSRDKIRIAIADEQPIILTGLCSILNNIEQLEVTFSCSTGEDLLTNLMEIDKPCDILLTDFVFSHEGNDDHFRLIKKILSYGKAKYLFIFTDVRCGWTINKLLSLGVSGILSKRDDVAKHLIAAISLLRRKEIYLSPYIEMLLEYSKSSVLQSSLMLGLTERELQVVRLYVDGLRLKDIAEKLCRSAATVAVHKHNAMQKLNITNNIHLVSYVRSLDCNHA